MELKDSGARRQFSTGAVRDVTEDKGRCDLLPLTVLAPQLKITELRLIDEYVHNGNAGSLRSAIEFFICENYNNEPITAVLELAKHYEAGAQKYSERNWEHGIPVHCFIDSGVRHLLKFYRKDTDEPHDRAFLWNMYGALWTHSNHPELIDLPFVRKDTRNEPIN